MIINGRQIDETQVLDYTDIEKGPFTVNDLIRYVIHHSEELYIRFPDYKQPSVKDAIASRRK